MTELIEIYGLTGRFLGLEERKKFYSEIRKEFDKKGKVSRQVKTVRAILLNSEGKIYLQKRSKFKDDNAGLYDKTIGAHIIANETPEMTLIRECAEELGFPATALSANEFEKAVKTINLEVIGIFKKIDYISPFWSVRIDKKGRKLIQPHMSSFFLGYYDGSIRFRDGESSGIEVFSLKELIDEIKNKPEKFTEDIKIMVEKYKKLIKPIK